MNFFPNMKNIEDNERNYVDILKVKMSSLSLKKPIYKPFSVLMADVEIVDCEFGKNDMTIFPEIYNRLTGENIYGIKKAILKFANGVCNLKVIEGNLEYLINVAMDGSRILSYINKENFCIERVYASGYWETEKIFTIKLEWVETCFEKVISFEILENIVRTSIYEEYPDIDENNFNTTKIVIGEINTELKE